MFNLLLLKKCFCKLKTYSKLYLVAKLLKFSDNFFIMVDY